jgi:hypothetical protein
LPLQGVEWVGTEAPPTTQSANPPDFIVNILLTILGFIPGLIHGLYVLYIYYDRRDQIAQGRPATGRAPGIYSDKVQSGGGATYGTMR